MTFSEHLKTFQEILKKVGEMFPGSHPVIGGGALRDAWHGRPIKDVDIFLRAEEFPLGVNHPKVTTLIPQHVCGYSLRSDMHGVWDYEEEIEGHQVQFIVADFFGARDLAATFDLGLSRITYDGNAVFTHEDFIRDSIDKVFRILRADDDGQTLRSERRIDRLLLKYPEFKRAA